MAAFAVISLAANPALQARIIESYPNSFHILAPNAWLVAAGGVTTQEICTTLTIQPGGISGAIVLKIDSYYGFASKAIWEWLAVKATEI
jgi:hypothetical protein